MKSDTATIEREKTIKEIVRMLANTDEEALRFIRSFLRTGVSRAGGHARHLGV